jgi:carbamoyltransferase
MSKIVMGLSVGHNRGAAITVDGILKVAIANERITRIKTDRSDCLPFEAMDYCINTLDITYDDITIFVYNTTEHANNIPNEFTWHTNQHLDKLSFIPHHIAHAYSTFHASGYKDAVVVVADAMGSVYNDVTPIKEWYTLDESDLGIGYEWAEGFSIYEFKDGVAFKSPEPLYKKWVRFPFSNEHEGSIGYLYGVGARQLVYNEKSNSWPAGKLMGLASYADPKYLEGIQNYSTRTLTDLEVPAFRIMGDVTHKDDFQSKANVAGIYQREQELNSIHLVEMASRISESKNICVAGGSFLNCNTNELIIKSELFEGMYFLPPADDSGIAIGCAFAKSNSESFKPTGKFLSPYTGKTYSNEEIEEATASFNNIIVTKLKPGEASMQAAALISTNKVIGWMQDGLEVKFTVQDFP